MGEYISDDRHALARRDDVSPGDGNKQIVDRNAIVDALINMAPVVCRRAAFCRVEAVDRVDVSAGHTHGSTVHRPEGRLGYGHTEHSLRPRTHKKLLDRRAV